MTRGALFEVVLLLHPKFLDLGPKIGGCLHPHGGSLKLHPR